ncbi:heavy metal translocating P-type ATPase [Candidatus Albibeggiatoa sp. nov. NOAA]|uniref:heavy metal translocating P-type ATPase n=1 Tax=Candidatus Albibeggiatoa sp. nov. NOAA TaxID=3162724 RepID=UPI003301F706|nr:heavy metal translocating P-type ATPase [Thiotrichaceae bacterium]
MSHCYHCGLPVPENADFFVKIQGQQRAMCCAGCQAVAQSIMDAGLDDFYQHRTENAPTGRELVPEVLKEAELYDNPEVQKRFVRHETENVREAALILEGITCAACVWLNEKHIKALDGVIDVQVNYSNHRARVRWDDSQIQLSQILQAVTQIGYIAHPYDPNRQQEVLDRERKTQLRRIGLAGVLGMQVMMFSIALYTGDWWGIEPQFRYLFYWVNLALTLPVLIYSAEPFFRSAWRDLTHKQAGMDVPVSLGIGLAFIGSVWTTFNTQSTGHVYYDSIVMFVFFLLTGRYFELLARQRSAQAAETLVHVMPTMATRLTKAASGEITEELVLVAELNVGDTVLVKAGETIPADGMVLVGQSSVDESLLTGESYPITKTIEQEVIGGTINIESPLQIEVTKLGTDTILSHILRLLERAQSEKPAITRLADQVAAYFVLAVLVLAVLVASYWWMQNPNNDAWFVTTLAVLVVTCPCALSLATPTAITAATSTLTRSGLLTTRGHALETLAKADHFVFDKTGTLTEGRLKVLETHCLAHWAEQTCLAYAAALERHSEHPIGTALLQAFNQLDMMSLKVHADNVNNQVGAGLMGEIGQKTFYIGTIDFIQTQTGLTLQSNMKHDLLQKGHSLVLLADQQHIYAAFVLGDSLRDGAKELVQTLLQQGKQVSLLSGDHRAVVENIAQQVGIEHIGYDLSPEDKLRRVKQLQSSGAIVAMVGDGVNDAPVLAQAAVSIAMGSGTQVARASADMILLTEQLPNLLIGIQTATKTLTIIRQNMLWAIGYNVLALPAAAMGYIAPWMAAIGMSLSSLLVVSNALRLVAKR